MAGGIITTASHPKALWPGVKGWWGNAYDEFPVEWTDLVDQDSDDRNYVELVQDTGFGLGVVKPQGDMITYDSNTQGFTARGVHVTYALGYMVTLEEIQDDQYETVSRARAPANAFSMRQTKENVVANIYNRAFTAGFVGGDGVTLASTAHPLFGPGGGTLNNKPTVDADLSEASLEDACVDLMGWTNDRAMRINVMPRKLIVSRQDWYNANRILKSVFQSGTANNDINALRATNSIPEGIAVNHYLTSPHAWFLRTSVRGRTGLCLFQRMPITFDQDNDFDTKNAKAASMERYVVMWGDWRALYCVNGP